MENNFLTALTGQSTHGNLDKNPTEYAWELRQNKNKMRRRQDLSDKMRRRPMRTPEKNLACGTFFLKKFLFLIIRGCISFQVSYSVYQFISTENDSNSNTEWSQRHNLYQTVLTKVLNNKHFVKSNLLRYKLHNTISIAIFCIRNNVRQHM